MEKKTEKDLIEAIDEYVSNMNKELKEYGERSE